MRGRRRFAQAANVFDIPLLDHLIVGDAGRHFSFREAGMPAAQIPDGVTHDTAPGHHAA